MKRFRIVFILLAVAAIALPPVFGVLTESQVQARVESLRANETLSVQVESYEREWFSSSALISIAPALPEAAAAGAADRVPESGAGGASAGPAADVMEVRIDFDHGPLSLRDGFFLGASEFVAYPVSAAHAAAYPFEFRGQTSFDGELNFVADLPPVDLALESGGISSSGGRITGTVVGRHLTANAEAETFRFESETGSVALQGITASADNEILSRYVMPGVVEIGIARASMDTAFDGPSPGMPDLEMSGFSLRTHVGIDADGALLDTGLSIAVDTARAGEDTLVADGRFETTATRIDIGALEAYFEAARRLAAGPQSRSDELEPAIERLLAAGPTLSIDPLRFDLDGLPFELTLLAETNPAALPATGPLELDNRELWYALLSGNAKLAAAKPLVERMATAIMKAQLSSEFMEGSAVPFEALDTMAEAQAGFVLAMLAAQGMIEDTGSLYRMEVRLEDGTLTANGNPLPFGLR